MIFGFNTDIKQDGTVYHVQSEARQHDLLLQTQVFVRGRCIGKHASSYAAEVSRPDFSDEHMHALLKGQHKQVIEAIRNGGLEAILDSPPTQSMPAVVAEAPAAPASIEIECPTAGTVYREGELLMQFLVRRDGQPLENAQLTARLNAPDREPVYAQAASDGEGRAEMRIAADERDLADASILVQALHNGDRATHKFRLRR